MALTVHRFKNYAFIEGTIDNTDFDDFSVSEGGNDFSCIYFKGLYTHFIIKNDDERDDVRLEYTFSADNDTLAGILHNANCDSPIVKDGVNISRIRFRTTDAGEPHKLRMWAWVRGGGGS